MWLCQNIPPSASAPVSMLQAIILFNFEGTNQLRDDFATCLCTSIFFDTRPYCRNRQDSYDFQFQLSKSTWKERELIKIEDR